MHPVGSESGRLVFAGVGREILPLPRKLGLKELRRRQVVPPAFWLQQESFLRSEHTVILWERARGVKPSRGDVNGTRGTPSPTAEAAYGSTRGAVVVRTYRFWAAAAHSHSPVTGGGPQAPCTSNSTKTHLPRRHQADQGLMGQQGYGNHMLTSDPAEAKRQNSPLL